MKKGLLLLIMFISINTFGQNPAIKDRADVIALKPSVVIILGGANGIAGL